MAFTVEADDRGWGWSDRRGWRRLSFFDKVLGVVGERGPAFADCVGGFRDDGGYDRADGKGACGFGKRFWLR